MDKSGLADVVLATPWLDSALEQVGSEGIAQSFEALDWCLRRSVSSAPIPDDWRSWLLRSVPGGPKLLESHPPGPTLYELTATRSAYRLPASLGFAPACWACARPVHLRAAIDHLWLEPELRPSLATAECSGIVAALNEQLAESGCALLASDSRDWLFASRELVEVRSWSPEEAAGRAIRETLPTGRDAQRIRRLMNEMQMLLHEHDCNEKRTALGQHAANAVWLWGFGAAGATATAAVSLPPLASTDDWLRNLWSLFGGRVDSPETLLASAPSARPVLIADSASVDAAEVSQQIHASEAGLFTPLRRALIERRVRAVEWFTGTATRRIAGSGSWWRRWIGRG